MLAGLPPCLLPSCQQLHLHQMLTILQLLFVLIFQLHLMHLFVLPILQRIHQLIRLFVHPTVQRYPHTICGQAHVAVLTVCCPVS